VPGLKKEYSYISTPPLGLRGLFYGELYFTLLTYDITENSESCIPLIHKALDVIHVPFCNLLTTPVTHSPLATQCPTAICPLDAFDRDYRLDSCPTPV
jgi:hypothetical protein